jgi:hypothetical protein
MWPNQSGWEPSVLRWQYAKPQQRADRADGVIVMPTDLGSLKQVLPDDAGLKRELTQAFLNYLGAPPAET